MNTTPVSSHQDACLNSVNNRMAMLSAPSPVLHNLSCSFDFVCKVLPLALPAPCPATRRGELASGPGLTRGPWAELTLGALRPALCPVCVCVVCPLLPLSEFTEKPSSQGSPQDTREGLTHRHVCSQPHVARTDGVQVSQWGPSRCPRWPGSLTWCCSLTPRRGGGWATGVPRAGDEGSQELLVAESVVRSLMPPSWTTSPAHVTLGAWGAEGGSGEGPRGLESTVGQAPPHALSCGWAALARGTLTGAPAQPRPGVPWEGGRWKGAGGPQVPSHLAEPGGTGAAGPSAEERHARERPLRPALMGGGGNAGGLTGAPTRPQVGRWALCATSQAPCAGGVAGAGGT